MLHLAQFFRDSQDVGEMARPIRARDGVDTLPDRRGSRGVSGSDRLGDIIGRRQELVPELRGRRARLLDKCNPPVPACPRKHLLGDGEKPSLLCGVADRTRSEMASVVIHGAEEDEAARDVVYSGRLVHVDAPAEKEVDDSFFEDARGN